MTSDVSASLGRRPHQLAGATAASHIIRLLSTLATLVALGRSSGPEVVGRVSVLLAVLSIAQSLTSGGTHNAAVRNLVSSARGLEYEANTILWVRFAAAIPAFALATLALAAMGALHRFAGLALAACIAGYALGAIDFPELAMASRNQFVRMGGIRLALTTWFLVPKLWLALNGEVPALVGLIGLEVAMWQWALWPDALKTGDMSLSLRRRWLGAAWREMVHMRYLWIGSIVAAIGIRVDLVIVSLLLGDAAAGWYATTTRLVESGVVLAGALAGAEFRDLVLKSNIPRPYAEAVTRGLRHMLTLALFTVVSVATIGPWLIRIVYGEGFEPAAELVPLYSLTLLPLFLRIAQAQVLVIEGRFKFAAVTSSAGLLVIVSAGFLLGADHGVAGVASATLAGYVVTLMSFPPTRRGLALAQVSWLAIATHVRRTESAAQLLIEERADGRSSRMTPRFESEAHR